MSLGMLGQIFSDRVVELVGTKYLAGIPPLQHFKHNLLDVVQVSFRFQRVVDAVIALFVEFFVGDIGVVAEVGAPGRLHQTVRH